MRAPSDFSLVNFFARVISIAPALTFALSGASALPGVLAFAGTEPVLGFIDVAVDHELSGLLVFIPVGSVHGLFVWEHLSEMVWVTFNLGGGDGSDKSENCKCEFHYKNYFILYFNMLTNLKAFIDTN